ncbi:MAG TPA: DUF6263 family protein [Flavobacteriales bacterium]|nr:DUF6263 family protein [Flavobacteriales bacterium]
MRNTVWLLTFACLTVVFTGCGDDKEESQTENDTSLNYKFKKGDTFYVDLDLLLVIAPQDTTNKKRDTIKQITTFKYVVDRVEENGTADMTLTYEHLKTNTFDSNDSAQRTTREGLMFAGMMNYTIKTKIDKKGNVLEVSGADNFLHAGQKDTLIDDNACLQTALNQFFNVLPPRETSLQQSWSTNHVVNYGYPAKFANTLTLARMDGDMATINITSKVTPNPAGLTSFPGIAVLMRHNLNGDRQGTTTFDMKKGMITYALHVDNYIGELIIDNKTKIGLKVMMQKTYTVRY